MAANDNNSIQGFLNRGPRNPVDNARYNELIQTIFAGFAPTYKNYLRGYDKNLRKSLKERDVFIQELLNKIDLLETENTRLTQENQDLRDQVQSLENTLFESGADLFDETGLPNPEQLPEEQSSEKNPSENQTPADYIIQDDYFIF